MARAAEVSCQKQDHREARGLRKPRWGFLLCPSGENSEGEPQGSLGQRDTDCVSNHMALGPHQQRD